MINSKNTPARKFSTLLNLTARYTLLQKEISNPMLTGKKRLYNSLEDALAYGVVTSRGDHVYIAGGFSDVTFTDGITISKANVTIEGLGTIKPVFAPASGFTAARSLFVINAAGVTLKNIHIDEPLKANVAAAIKIAGVDYVTLEDITIQPTSTTLTYTDVIEVWAGSDHLTIRNCRIAGEATNGGTTEPTSFLHFHGASTDIIVEDNIFIGAVATGGILDTAKVTRLVLKNNLVGVIGTNMEAVVLDSNPTGVAVNNMWAGTNGVGATDCALGNSMTIFNNRVLGETDGSVQGSNIFPPVDVQ